LDQVQYSTMASRTPNQAWSEGFDASTIHTVTSNSRTSSCQCSLFKEKSNYLDFLHIRMACHPNYSR